jgi:hypothetical protein
MNLKIIGIGAACLFVGATIVPSIDTKKLKDNTKQTGDVTQTMSNGVADSGGGILSGGGELLQQGLSLLPDAPATTTTVAPTDGVGA